MLMLLLNRHNQQVRQVRICYIIQGTCSLNVIKGKNNSRMIILILAECAARLGGMRNAYKMLVGKPEGKKETTRKS